MLKMVFQKIGRKLLAYLEEPVFKGDDIQIGRGVRFGKNVRFNCQSVCIGDGCVFGDNITVDATHFSIGDYGTIYTNCFFPGPGSLEIGHNFWMGTGAILDAKGGTKIANNVGIGAYSQLWTHFMFGDVMEGCNFHQESPLTVENDVWVAPKVVVTSSLLEEKSLLLTNAIVTQNTLKNNVYGGIPAKNLSSKFGAAFTLKTFEEKQTYFISKLNAFTAQTGINWKKHFEIGELPTANSSVNRTIFDLTKRHYSKRFTKEEIQFMRFLLPDAKFVPAHLF